MSPPTKTPTKSPAPSEQGFSRLPRTTRMSTELTVAAVQLCSTADARASLDRALSLVRAALEGGARLVALPENYAFLGGESDKLAHAQSAVEGPFVAPLRELAREHGAHVLAGSIPEVGPDAQHVYNTSVLIGPDGDVVSTYRKIHLFDVDFADGPRLLESAHVTPGEAVAVAEVDGWSVGLSICYDLRFPELYRRLVEAGAELITIPAAFTLHTGKDHWEVLVRARAIEAQCYVVAPAQFGAHGGGRSSWGKSMIVDPWGTPLATAPEREGYVMAELSRQALHDVRRQLPALRHRRL